MPKRDLAGVLQVLLQVLLQAGRLKAAEALPLPRTLLDELVNFRVTIDLLTAHDSYGAWREGQHDDLVLALACAASYGEHWRPAPVRAPAMTISMDNW